MKEAKSFGSNLRHALKDLMWTQKDLAYWAGITPAAVSQIVNDKREPSLDTLVRIINATGYSFENLINGDFY